MAQQSPPCTQLPAVCVFRGVDLPFVIRLAMGTPADFRMAVSSDLTLQIASGKSRRKMADEKVKVAHLTGKNYLAGWQVHRMSKAVLLCRSRSWRNDLGSAPGFAAAGDDGRGLVNLCTSWLFAITFGCLEAKPWLGQLRLSSSLRTLLIATTLVAELLGLIFGQWEIDRMH